MSAPNAPPPKRLVTDDLIAGSGKVAHHGDEVEVEYVGVLYASGRRFDSSWKRGEIFSLKLGQEHAVSGFERGIEGMRVGGRRRLTVPPRLAYGATGLPPKIPPNETLIFVVDLLGVR